ncbi:MAG: hypothetical protein ABI837_12890 [Acidobacteriota bacterium]
MESLRHEVREESRNVRFESDGGPQGSTDGDFATLKSPARFDRLRFEPLGDSCYLANAQNRHVYDFYVKP